MGPSEVRIRMVAAPIHGADFDAITGISGAARSLPAVGGIEGAGVVEEVGSAVQSLNKDDVVVPGVPSLGTWRTHLVAAEDDLLRVPPATTAETAATLGVGPCTALRILSDLYVLCTASVATACCLSLSLALSLPLHPLPPLALFPFKKKAPPSRKVTWSSRITRTAPSARP